MPRDERIVGRGFAILLILGIGMVAALDTPAPTTEDQVSKTSTSTSTTRTMTPMVDGEPVKEKSVDAVSPSSGRKDAARRDRGSYSMIFSGDRGRRGGKQSASRRDSYLEALRHSRTSEDPREGIVRMDVIGSTTDDVSRSEDGVYQRGPVYVSSESGIGTDSQSGRIAYHGSTDRGESFSFAPSRSYSLPSKTSVDFKDHSGFSDTRGSYGPPRDTYGPPSRGHPPQSSYGEISGGGGYYLPPQQAYGPPSHGLSHGHEIGHELSHEIPTIDFSWPFALKLNAFTLAKILLKLVIFKMIVKFIAVICLLLFIPKLQIVKKGNKDDADDDEGRRYSIADSSFVQLLTERLATALEKYEALKNEGSRSNSRDERWTDYVRLFEAYALEES